MVLSQRGLPVSSDSAGAAGRFKRQRVREAEARRQEQRVEDVLTHTTHIVDAIATINGKYVLTLNDERARLVHQVTELQTQLTKHQRQHAEDTTHLVLSEFARLRGVVSSGVKDRLLQSLREEANKGHADVFDAISAHVDDALQGSLAVADTELSAERQLNHTLVQQLQNYTQTLLREVKGATSRAFQAEVEVMQRDVLVAKLQAACVFAQNRQVRHEQEVDALMRVVAQLAEKSRYAESARADVRRAKHHVRLLEQHLGLNEIVAAVQAEMARAPSDASAEVRQSIGPPLAPDPSLRSSAPHYFAMKMLEHKEVTLTELVDSWQQQESRIMEAEQRYARLEGVVSRVQHDALVVHQRYLEEKQRREIADRRITDMVRERLHPQKDLAISQEVQRLRWAYTEVVDDAAQLAVNLKVCRDELQRSQEDAARLSAQVRQLQRDAETDQVALTIRELRNEYAARVRDLEEESTRAEMQLSLAQRVSKQYGAAATEATAALQRAAQANRELSSAALLVISGDRSTLATSSSAWREEVELVEAQAERLLSATAAAKEFAAAHGELYDTQMEALMRQWTLVREAEMQVRVPSTADSQLGEGRLPTVGHNSTDDYTESRTLVSSSIAAEESMDKANAVLSASQFALREALMLLNASLQSTDVERSHLVDASLSDAQYVTELIAEVRRVTAERDRLRAQVNVCQELLEKNHVTVVERALMHDVPVEDSLNVAEATERIEVLKNQLAAAKQVCERALNEVKQVTAEKGDVELRLTELAREHEVLQRHTSRLTDRLHGSLARESELREKNMALQTQLTDLVQLPGVTTVEAEASSIAPHTTSARLTDLFSSLQESLGSLSVEVGALRRERADGASRETDVGSGDNNGPDADGVEDALLVDSLSRSGMMSIVRVLKETLHKVGLLKVSLRSVAGAQAAGLCAAAKECGNADGGSGAALTANVVPPPSPETQQRALEYRYSLLEAKLMSMVAERLEMQGRLQKAEKTTADMEAANQRLLTISKSVIEKQNTLKTENEQLQAQLRQLTTAANAASTPLPELLAAPGLTTAPVSAQMPTPHEGAVTPIPYAHAVGISVPSEHVEWSATVAPAYSTSATQPRAPTRIDDPPVANASLPHSGVPVPQEQIEEGTGRAPEGVAANVAVTSSSEPINENVVPQTEASLMAVEDLAEAVSGPEE
ncbi:hypothetical protein LPMP_250280 [Leishmania panamensis]|uniref:Uncharacterized protein n=1 Tax=Leishmania panamensis TaxID=5679 RepID=A0A088RSE3_LEIPA|nr:hypothetical protein LPMP_250280 [Leishmania panamensis]AIN98893.1 hypothetical protein LPMP_250280 [Leishmania panamensis]